MGHQAILCFLIDTGGMSRPGEGIMVSQFHKQLGLKEQKLGVWVSFLIDMVWYCLNFLHEACYTCSSVQASTDQKIKGIFPPSGGCCIYCLRLLRRVTKAVVPALPTSPLAVPPLSGLSPSSQINESGHLYLHSLSHQLPESSFIAYVYSTLMIWKFTSHNFNEQLFLYSNE